MKKESIKWAEFSCIIICIFTKSAQAAKQPCSMGKAGACAWVGGTRARVAWNSKSNNTFFFLFPFGARQKCEYLTKNCICWVKYLHGSGLWSYFTSDNCSTSISMFVCPVEIVFSQYYFSCWSKPGCLLKSSAKSGQFSLLSVIGLAKSLGFIVTSG